MVDFAKALTEYREQKRTGPPEKVCLTIETAIAHLRNKLAAGASMFEPVFILYAHDYLSAETVRYWADIAEADQVNGEKILGAVKCADEMMKWPIRRKPD